jgi:hypothetical protein
VKKGTYPISSLVKTSHKKFEDPQNDKKEIENFQTSKYQNKIKDPQNEKKIIESSQTSKETKLKSGHVYKIKP